MLTSQGFCSALSFFINLYPLHRGIARDNISHLRYSIYAHDVWDLILEVSYMMVSGTFLSYFGKGRREEGVELIHFLVIIKQVFVHEVLSSCM